MKLPALIGSVALLIPVATIGSVALLIPVATLTGGCQKASPFASGNHSPVNEAAMPTPEPTVPPVSADSPSPAPSAATSSTN